MDETWIYHYDAENRNNSLNKWQQPGLPPPKKAKTVPSAWKVMASVVLHADGILTVDDLQKEQIINGQYYASLLRQLRENLWVKRLGKLSKGVMFHQDNAVCHCYGCHQWLWLWIDSTSLLHAWSRSIKLPFILKLEKGYSWYTLQSILTSCIQWEDFLDSEEKDFYKSDIGVLQHRWQNCIGIERIMLKNNTICLKKK